MILPILRWPDPVLSTPCAPAVLSEDLRALAADMLETMYAAPGRGLAAPQVGRLLRMFVMDAGWKEGRPAPVVLVNPVVLWASDRQVLGPEGCLSIPGPTTQVARAEAVRMRWTALDGAVQEETLIGFAAICAQHEFDHLDGILTLDRLSPEARARAEAEVLA
jgi:peptide deformylase